MQNEIACCLLVSLHNARFTAFPNQGFLWVLLSLSFRSDSVPQHVRSSFQSISIKCLLVLRDAEAPSKFDYDAAALSM